MAPADELRVRLRRHLPAPPGEVYRMHTDPAELARWWGPRGFRAPSVELDVRPGGRYRIEMQPPAGDAFFLTGEYVEVDPPGRLAYTFRWEEPDPDDRANVVVITFGEAGAGTELAVDHGTFATEARRALHADGWADSLDRLGALLAPPGP